jgi:DUF1365 family protein
MTTDRAAALPMLGSGVVRHRRLRPRDNRFEYPTRFVLLPMRALPAAGVPGLPPLEANERLRKFQRGARAQVRGVLGR